MFSSKSLIVLPFAFKSKIYIGFMCIWNDGKEKIIFFPHMDIQLITTHYNGLSPFTWIRWPHLCESLSELFYSAVSLNYANTTLN